MSRKKLAPLFEPKKLKIVEIRKPREVQVVRHGKWIICCDGYYPYCSECGNEPQGRAMTDYCPNCGAKMDGDDNA